MLEKLLQLKTRNNSLKEFTDSVHQGIPSVVFGVSGAFKNFMVSNVDEPVLLVVKDGITAGVAVKEIEELSGKKAIYIPPKDDTLIISRAFSKDSSYARIIAFDSVRDTDVIVVTPETLIQRCPKSIDRLIVDKNEELDIYSLIQTLVLFGYKRVENVESQGTFSVRGDVVDIFSINYTEPIRIDFFDDTIESIRQFDLEKRRTKGRFDRVKILPCVEYSFNDSDKKLFREKILKEVRTAVTKAKLRLQVVADEVLTAIENGDSDILSLLSTLSDKSGNIFDLIKDNTVVIFDEAKLIYETATLHQKEFTERFNSLYKAGEIFSFMGSNCLGLDVTLDLIKKYRLSALQTLTTTIPFFNPLKVINPTSSGVSNYQIAFNEVYNDISNWLVSGYTVLVCAGDERKAERFSYDLSGQGIASSIGGKNLRGVVVTVDKLNRGFIFHEEKIAVIGSGNLFTKPPSQTRPKKRNQVFFNAPEKGDYCVHEVHGIGRVLGNKKISTTEGTKDYISVEYAGGDILSIPVEQMDILSRYLGADKTPRLSKIGGKDFDRIKRTVKESIKKMSFDIKRLYSERQALNGYKFNDDNFLQSAFDNAFPFEETDDQITASLEIKEDMTSGRVMDRLVCGDVGFGKTEVAFRAVFRAIVNGKQVAMLAPTTILTEQHYNTAKQRFGNFGIKIACLNRFRTAKQQQVIIDKLKKGEIDFVIGTHRLLSKDIAFKDLGLLVLDEEQRFGVEHKEKIKLLKKDVDTLTLTATPIPRTLHMSLSGMRDISAINTPPKQRLPVQTYVVEQTDAVIKDAIEREVNRGGQVFVLYNRVESIYIFADYIKALLPNLKCTIAHGQMDEKTLEKSIMEFYDGKTDALIATTIIENGIDLPRANTLIVIDADTLGLSTLYQLKGRVGRSDRLAYAYFTFKREKILTQTAYERLNAITDFTEMGSGIKIAMRDLEIRGAGNVLGSEQHGHMDKIGYELYSKLLREELNGKEETFPELDIRVTAYIPEDYIASSSLRMDAYKEIAEISSAKDEGEFIGYATESFGEVPNMVKNLINISVVKRLAMKLGITEITIKKERAYLAFNNIQVLNNKSLADAIDSAIGVTIKMTDKAYIEFDNYMVKNEVMLKKMRDFLSDATK